MKMMNNRTQKKQFGFTLIEMLIGMSIFSIIVMGLYGVFWSAITINKRSEEVNSVYREARWSMERLAKDLENMVYYQFGSQYPEEQLFKSESGKITFVIADEAGLKVVKYYIDQPDYGTIHRTGIGQRVAHLKEIVTQSDQDDSMDFLMREEQSLVDYLQFQPEDNIEKEVLSIYVKEDGLQFQYAYFQEDAGPTEIQWSDQWKENYLPLGMRVTMTFWGPSKGAKELVLTREIVIPPGSWGEDKIDL